MRQSARAAARRNVAVLAGAHHSPLYKAAFSVLTYSSWGPSAASASMILVWTSTKGPRAFEWSST